MKLNYGFRKTIARKLTAYIKTVGSFAFTENYLPSQKESRYNHFSITNAIHLNL
jgi:hypothetical protein